MVLHPFLLSKSVLVAYYDNALDFDGGMTLKIKKVFILGGDKRSLYARDYFASEGYSVSSFGIGKENESLADLKEADIAVMGLPATKDGFVNMPLSDKKITFEEVMAKCPVGSLVFGGRFSEMDYSLAKKAGVLLQDYSEDEVFKSENALYTAEGIIKYLVENTAKSVRDLNILITGYGRISQMLCSLLVSWPCSLTVYARRSPARARCALLGVDTISELKELSGYDVIINTVPADIFNGEALSSVSEGAVIFDVSERPGFVNKELCHTHGIKLLYLPGIPLTSAPRSAGITAAKAIERFTEGN